eukprot:9625303-Prorocentrum_lima.AAC.1
MTSSLVGSEMCIRDRKSAKPQRAPLPGRKRRCQHGREHAPHSGASVWAVSYTHLTLPTICSV